MLQDTEHNIPDWEQCIFRTSYANIRTCIPEYMRVEEDLPAMDKIADEMNFKKKTEVREHDRLPCLSLSSSPAWLALS